MGIVADSMVTYLETEDRSFASGFRGAGIVLDQFSGRLAGVDDRLGEMLGGGRASAQILSFFGRAARSAGEEAAAFARASGNFKGSFPTSELEEFASKIQDLTGIDDGKIADTVGVLGTFKGISRSDAENLTLPLFNAAESLKALGVNSESLANQVGKAIQTGDAAGLKRVGIIVDDAGFKMQSTSERAKTMAQVLQQQGGDAAIAFRQTLPGAIQAAENSVGNLTDALGAPLSGPLNTAANLVDTLARTFTALPQPVQTVVSVGTVGFAAMLGLASLRSKMLAADTDRLIRTLALEAAGHKNAANAANQHANALGNVSAKGAGARVANGVSVADSPASGGSAGGGPGAATAAGAAAAGAATVAAKKPGALGKVGGFLKGKGGTVAAVAATMAADFALQQLPEEGVWGGLKAAGTGATTGAGIGMAVGSFIPGVGNVVGGVAGGIIGAGLGYMGHESEKAEARKAAGDTGGGDTARLVELMEENNRLLRAVKDGSVLDKSVLPREQQRVALSVGRALP